MYIYIYINKQSINGIIGTEGEKQLKKKKNCVGPFVRHSSS